MQRLEDTATSTSIAVAIAAYSLCSSTLLLANKLSLHYIPMPATTSLIQLAFAAVVVLLLKYVMKQDIDGFEWEKVRPYLYYVAIFVAAIYSNMQALSHSNVETVIVFRACSPIAVCAIEYFFMNRELPSTRSAASLLCVAVGAIVYCMSDSDFALKGLSAYYWVFIYFITIVLEMTYGKILTSSVKTVSVWAPVLYCNLFAVPPMFLLGLSEGGFNGVASALPNLGFAGFVVIAFSCVVGTLIGYSGWLCRGMVSATTYTLVGVVNKFLTVLLNVVVWDKHSTPIGIAAVCICLLSGSFYQQAPRRDVTHRVTVELTKSSATDEDKNPLIEKK